MWNTFPSLSPSQKKEEGRRGRLDAKMFPTFPSPKKPANKTPTPVEGLYSQIIDKKSTWIKYIRVLLFISLRWTKRFLKPHKSGAKKEVTRFISSFSIKSCPKAYPSKAYQRSADSTSQLSNPLEYSPTTSTQKKKHQEHIALSPPPTKPNQTQTQTRPRTSARPTHQQASKREREYSKPSKKMMLCRFSSCFQNPSEKGRKTKINERIRVDTWVKSVTSLLGIFCQLLQLPLALFLVAFHLKLDPELLLVFLLRRLGRERFFLLNIWKPGFHIVRGLVISPFPVVIPRLVLV